MRVHTVFVNRRHDIASNPLKLKPLKIPTFWRIAATLAGAFVLYQVGFSLINLPNHFAIGAGVIALAIAAYLPFAAGMSMFKPEKASPNEDA